MIRMTPDQGIAMTLKPISMLKTNETTSIKTLRAGELGQRRATSNTEPLRRL